MICSTIEEWMGSMGQWRTSGFHVGGLKFISSELQLERFSGSRWSKRAWFDNLERPAAHYARQYWPGLTQYKALLCSWRKWIMTTNYYPLSTHL